MKKFIAILILLAAPTAHAASPEFSKIWEMPITAVLNNYMDYDNKAAADDVLDNYIDGFVAGLIATYHYGAGNRENIIACMKVSGMTPTSIRKRLLSDARDSGLGTVPVATYLYAVVHINCDVVLGEYETSDGEKDTSS